MQRHVLVNLVDLVKSFPTNIYLQNLASIQKRTSPVKFAHLAEKSGKGSISNLSTKAKLACQIDCLVARSEFRLSTPRPTPSVEVSAVAKPASQALSSPNGKSPGGRLRAAARLNKRA